jgi:membrane-bound metal-dependent hydrolase YbcI (DUF457 family)
MDPFTHALTGIVAGQAFISGEDAECRRVARTALTLGAIFPDVDLIANPFEPYGLGTIHYHRGLTHSVVCMPLFAMLLGALAVWFCAWRRIRRPSWLALGGLFGAGIALHILFDLITSFGTMMWCPINWKYVNWDTTFILDPSLTLILLLPLLLAWAYRDKETFSRRAGFLWVALSAAGFGVAIVDQRIESIASATNQVSGYAAIVWPGILWSAVTVSVALAAVLGAPAIGGRGFRVHARNWCVVGIAATAIYLGLSAGAHAVALRRVQDFARERGLQVQNIGALPMPPSFLFWSGLVSTPDTVYHSYFNLWDGAAPEFREYRQSPDDAVIREAAKLPDVQIVLRFFRFPLILAHREPGGSTSDVEFHDLRFLPQTGKTLPFSYEVEIVNSSGQVLYRGKARRGPR